MSFVCYVSGRIDPTNFFYNMICIFDAAPDLYALRRAIEQQANEDQVCPDGSEFWVSDIEILDFRTQQWVNLEGKAQLYSGCLLTAIRDPLNSTSAGPVDAVSSKNILQRVLGFALQSQKLFEALDVDSEGALRLKGFLRVFRHDLAFAVEAFTVLDPHAEGCITYQQFVTIFHQPDRKRFFDELKERMEHGGRRVPAPAPLPATANGGGAGEHLALSGSGVEFDNDDEKESEEGDGGGNEDDLFPSPSRLAGTTDMSKDSSLPLAPPSVNGSIRLQSKVSSVALRKSTSSVVSAAAPSPSGKPTSSLKRQGSSFGGRSSSSASGGSQTAAPSIAETSSVSAAAVHRHFDAMLAAGVANSTSYNASFSGAQPPTSSTSPDDTPRKTSPNSSSMVVTKSRQSLSRQKSSVNSSRSGSGRTQVSPGNTAPFSSKPVIDEEL